MGNHTLYGEPLWLFYVGNTFTGTWDAIYQSTTPQSRYARQLPLTQGSLWACASRKAMMKGKKGKLFCLEFSFIGWIFLCILTLGILTLWVAPWMEAAKADFYESNRFAPAPAAGWAPAPNL